MKLRYTILGAIFSLSLSLCAQKTPFEKYEIPSTLMVDVILDYIKNFPSRMITNGADQYLGQTDPDGNIYGFGRFVRQDGTQIFGIFRNGELIQGITITHNAATVGSKTFYSSYGLSTGTLDYVFQAGNRQLYDTRQLSDYRFLSMSYGNGDQYMGEIYHGKRHGLGIYYYANGDIWFGQYTDNIRSGYGCLFSAENNLTIGTWNGEDQRRCIYVRMKRK